MAWVAAETTTWDKALEPDSKGVGFAVHPEYHAYIIKSARRGDESCYVNIGMNEDCFHEDVSYDALPSVLGEHGIPEDGWMSDEYYEQTHNGQIWVEGE